MMVDVCLSVCLTAQGGSILRGKAVIWPRKQTKSDHFLAYGMREQSQKVTSIIVYQAQRRAFERGNILDNTTVIGRRRTAHFEAPAGQLSKLK